MTESGTLHPDTEILRLFLYGTLKPGQAMHGLVRPYVIGAVPARVPGRLFHLPAGYPALQLPPGALLAECTLDPAMDAHLSAGMAVGTPQPPDGWGWVHGMVVTIHSPARCVAELDDYEDVRSGEECLYQRVLVAADCDPTPVAAWTYIMREGSGGRWLPEGVWPPE